MEHEKDILIKAGKEKLAKKVEHSSVIKGDGLGYDILSYDEEGNKKYIEVKTTVNKNNNSFYISSNEIEFSKSNKNYYLYVVKITDLDEMKGEVQVIKGDINKNLELIPIKFKGTIY
ncbi:MAG TPA: DUF3883 domain-containing protein [Clostridia bacterium]|nr:DUF3883 domain-containing protein [Clostridia bacterium]